MADVASAPSVHVFPVQFGTLTAAFAGAPSFVLSRFIHCVDDEATFSDSVFCLKIFLNHHVLWDV